MLRIHFMRQWFKLGDPSHGRSTARRARIPGLCGPVPRGRTPTQSIEHPAPGHRQRPAAGQRAAVEGWRGGGRHAHCGTKFHEEPMRRARPRDWAREGVLPGAQEEHGADRHAVCAGQPVDGAAQAAGDGAGTRTRDVRTPRPGTNGHAQRAKGLWVPPSPKAGKITLMARSKGIRAEHPLMGAAQSTENRGPQGQHCIPLGL